MYVKYLARHLHILNVQSRADACMHLVTVMFLKPQ